MGKKWNGFKQDNTGSFISLSFDRMNTDVRQKVTPAIAQGLSQTASGYGQQLVTRWMVRWYGHWRRVYCKCVSNSGTCYIFHKGERVIVEIM